MATVFTDPLILTLDLDATSREWFDKLRTAHFPPERNWLKAHLTLFHHLPPENEQIQSDLKRIAGETPVLSLRAAGLINLGRGVAVRIENEQLSFLQQSLQKRWHPWLTAQDRQKRGFHVTIQNKVSPTAALTLFRNLSATFQPFESSGTGLTLWAYKNGPWEWYRHFPLPVN